MSRYISEVAVAHALRGVERDLTRRMVDGDLGPGGIREVVDHWRGSLGIGREAEAADREIPRPDERGDAT